MIQPARNFVRKISSSSPFMGNILRLAKLVKDMAVLGLNINRKRERRLLVIYDLSTQPFSIGDILVFQIGALVLLEEYKCDFVDFALVYNPQNPTSGDPAFASITEENCLYHLAGILPVAQVNPNLGSIFLFNSHAQLQDFVADNLKRYKVWPSLSNYVSRKYMYHTIFNEIITGHFNRYGKVPFLHSRTNMNVWALTFLKNNVYPAIPVTVQLRRNLSNPTRNSNYDVWLSFFDNCVDRYPVKFVVLCAESEIDERLRKCSNVIIAKDFRTNIEQDLALIDNGAMHIGAASGPGALAMFSDKPFFFLNTSEESILTIGCKRHGRLIRTDYHNEVQNFVTEAETVEMLSYEFERMWQAGGPGYWERKELENMNSETVQSAWLR